LFRDYLANFRGEYAKKISSISVFHAELMALILAMEVAHNKTWPFLWLESDSLNALHAFDDMNVVPWDLRNRWSNCLNLV
jgi:ribonuclease HI